MSASASAEAVFPSRVDAWVVILLAASFLGGVAALWAGAREEPGEAWIGGAIFAATFGLVGLVAIPTRYHVTGDELVIRSGVMRYRVPLRSIQRVRPSSDLTASPAWSLDRLAIDYRPDGRRERILISPARREDFLALVGVRAELVPDGVGLRRPE